MTETPNLPREFHEPPDGNRIVRVYRNGSWLEDTSGGQRKHYSWPEVEGDTAPFPHILAPAASKD